jgi:hypothetical protein
MVTKLLNQFFIGLVNSICESLWILEDTLPVLNLLHLF